MFIFKGTALGCAQGDGESPASTQVDDWTTQNMNKIFLFFLSSLLVFKTFKLKSSYAYHFSSIYDNNYYLRDGLTSMNYR